MKVLTLKMRIVVLWIFSAASITAECALYLYEKGWIEKVMSGEASIGPRNFNTLDMSLDSSLCVGISNGYLEG